LINSGPTQARALLAVRVDGQLRDSRSVDIPGGGDATVTLEGLPLSMHTVEARLSTDEAGANLLAADDVAWVVRSRPPASNVLLVSEGNSFLEKALNLTPNVKLFKVTPAGYAPSEGFGLTVLDSFMPPRVPSGNLLLFAPPDSALVPVSGTLQYPTVGTVAVNEPLLRFVDLSGTHIGVAKRMLTPPWAQVLARTTSGEPLII